MAGRAVQLELGPVPAPALHPVLPRLPPNPESPVRVPVPRTPLLQTDPVPGYPPPAQLPILLRGGPVPETRPAANPPQPAHEPLLHLVPVPTYVAPGALHLLDDQSIDEVLRGVLRVPVSIRQV